MTGRLFEANGKPIGEVYTVFSLRECMERDTIRKLIEPNGGQLRLKWTLGCIHLEPGEPKSISTFRVPADHTVYSLKYVKDAVKGKSLPDLSHYTFHIPLSDPIEPDSDAGPTFKGRNKFTLAEEELMTQYMKRYQGSYTSLAYWTKALEQGLTVSRTAYTLRDHCKRMLEGKSVAKNEEIKSKKRETTPGVEKKSKVSPGSPVALKVPKPLGSSQPSPVLPTTIVKQVSLSTPPLSVPRVQPIPGSAKSRTSVESLSPRNLSSRFEVTSDLVVCVERGRRAVSDMKKYREQCDQAHIIPQFLSLVAKCKRKSSLHPDDEVEVLQTLLACKGDVSQCLKHYSVHI